MKDLRDIGRTFQVVASSLWGMYVSPAPSRCVPASVGVRVPACGYIVLYSDVSLWIPPAHRKELQELVPCSAKLDLVYQWGLLA